MRLIVHIGTPKTGSTSIQSFLAVVRPHYEETGVCVPRAGWFRNKAHFNFARQLTASRRYRPKAGSFPELEEELRNTKFDVAVISSENLWQVPAAAPRFLQVAEAIGAEPEVVAFLRPQRELLDALYSQAVKSGYVTKSFEAFVREYLDRETTDYVATLEHWAGYRRIVLRHAGDAVSGFLDATGLEDRLGGFERPAYMNERVTTSVMTTIMETMVEMRDRGVPREQREREAKALMRTLPPDGPRYTGLTPEIAQLIDESVAERNQRLAEHYGVQLD